MTEFSPADVAVPGPVETALVEYVDHPGGEHLLGCPNCGDGDELVAIIRATVEQDLAVVYDVETTTPDYELNPDEWEVGETATAEEVVGVRCAKCRWGYQGPDPLARLRRIYE